MPSLYLVNPACDVPPYYGSEVMAAKGMPAALFMADLAVATVAGLAPDDFDVAICEQAITAVDFDSDADFIGITGKISQTGNMKRIAAEFRRRGKTVIIGGPHASLSPEHLRDDCDILVQGEAEAIAGDLFSDLRAGRWKDTYVGDRPDLSLSPVPRWERYPNSRAAMGMVQTSRGCPFECEFCDVIQYLGRKQRHKPVAQVLAELEEVSRHGYSSVFLADDNLTVYRARAKELMAAIGDWNRRRPQPLTFVTQVSIEIAEDDEMLRLCAEAGLVNVFIGIETPNEESMRVALKRQNVGVDLVASVGRFLEHGIMVSGGLIVGFDADGPDIFERQYEFVMASGVPIFSLGTLVAPEPTPLYERLASAGRIFAADRVETAAAPWSTNIVPALMTRDELLDGVKWLCDSIYDAGAFACRIEQMAERIGPRRIEGTALDRIPPRQINREQMAMMTSTDGADPGERELIELVLEKMAARPEIGDVLGMALFFYHQAHYMLGRGQLWEAIPTGAPATRPTAEPALVTLGGLSR